VVVLVLLVLASVFDYPLRVPSLMALAVIAAFWTRSEVMPPKGLANHGNIG
jgi:hypothetical protein